MSAPEAKSLTTRQRAKIATRAKVLAGARQAFDCHGYQGADIRTIAAGIEMSTGAVFANFDSKDALYREIYGHPPISPELGRDLLEALKAADAFIARRGLVGEGPAVIRAAIAKATGQQVDL